MAATLLQRWLAHYDPIHLGRTPMGIAAGAHAAAGRGWFGGARVLLFKGASRAAIGKSYPVGMAGSEALSIELRDGIELAVGTHYFQAIPYGPGGVAAVVDATRPQIVAVVVDEDGLEPRRPAAPRGLKATASAGGEIRLTWEFVASSSRPATAAFRVFSDGGTGTVDYDTPVDTVLARMGLGGTGLYAWSDTYSHGTAVEFAVRSVTFGGVDDGNTSEVSATADSQEPAVGAIDAIALGEDL